ncbi:hypothetical protein BGZ61DRAFT_483229 [Ilyonectria robusta]|uniref:uncharacterized protein n=1 Tax=Ilyonectria robusta TaxID=1079257 RepID=UPI001E8DF017|nr:uncharacterized protein BGZ61DRAFT_483229 [Ilyonectria robusta]KAH8669924.1 hypothetical protein BGZ61DRAFT_483229 [Ilyonectria robusta]
MMEIFPEAFGMGARSIWPMILDEIQSPPTPMEDLIDMPRSTTSAPSPAKDPVWTGGIVSLPTVDDFISRIQLINIPPKNLSWMIKTCKQHGVSINSYLHGHICACLCRAIGGTPDFRAVTPFSVRGLTKASPRDIVNHISYMSTHVSNAKMKGIRESIPHSLTEHECIINLARDFGQDIAAEVKRFPRDSALANLWQIQDIRSHCLNQEGKKRECTYELSNLGATENQASADSPLTLERLMFTQSGMVAGPAIGFNCVSIRGGPLTMAITWQYGIVDESLINTLAHGLEKRLMQERPQTPAPVEETGGNRPGRWR